jgi:tRNA(Ile)-lysidine synthase
MNRKALATIEQFAMLGQGDTVTAAVSGGADSVALLDFLCSLTGMGLTVRACHLNHCLRGAESDRDEQLVRTMWRGIRDSA